MVTKLVLDEKNKVKEILVDILDVKEDEINEITKIGGMTNVNYKILINDEYFVLRVPGVGTEAIISRKNEIINSNKMSDIGINVEIPYFNEESGIKISKYIQNAETLNPLTAKEKVNMDMMANLLKKLHTSNIKLNNIFNVITEIEKYEEEVKALDGALYDNYYEVREIVLQLNRNLNKFDLTLCPSHNDTVPENFVKDKEERLYLIDWEYSGMNDNMWDIAALFIECGYTKEDEEKFLQEYFKVNNEVRIINENSKIRILIHKISQDFLWSIWTIMKELKGDDFGTYGIDRYNRAINNIKVIESIVGKSVGDY